MILMLAKNKVGVNGEHDSNHPIQSWSVCSWTGLVDGQARTG
ncbi:MAG: hypothetical protein ACE3JQ_02495 [Paenisporosarcina sp.]